MAKASRKCADCLRKEQEEYLRQLREEMCDGCGGPLHQRTYYDYTPPYRYSGGANYSARA